MNDTFTKEFFSVIDGEKGVSREKVAEELGNSTKTISTWKSIGVPNSRRLGCQALMEKLLNVDQEELDSLKNTLVMHIDRKQFNNWNRAALEEGKMIEDWATEGLDAMAKEYFEEIDKKVTTFKVTEDETAYQTRHEMEYLGAAAAGSGVTGDHLGSVMLRNQYPAHYKAVKVIGDSMDDGSEISIADGCVAIVNPNWHGKPYAEKNKIYAWNIDDGQVLKKFVRRKVNGKTQGFLESLNPAYKSIPYTDDMIPQGEFVAVEC